MSTTDMAKLNQSLRELQDLEFQASLQQDQEKDLKKMMDEQEVKNSQREKKAIIDSRLAKRANLPAEPSTDDSFCSLAIRLPSGTRLTRRFLMGSPLQSILDFVDSFLVEDDFMVRYSILSNFPKINLSQLDSSSPIESVLGSAKSHALFVEREE